MSSLVILFTTTATGLVKSTQLQTIIDWIMRKSFCLRRWATEAQLKGFKSDFPALTILRRSSLSWKTFNYFSAHFSHFFAQNTFALRSRGGGGGGVGQTSFPKLSPHSRQAHKACQAGPPQSMAKVKKSSLFFGRAEEEKFDLLLDARI